MERTDQNLPVAATDSGPAPAGTATAAPRNGPAARAGLPDRAPAATAERRTAHRKRDWPRTLRRWLLAALALAGAAVGYRHWKLS